MKLYQLLALRLLRLETCPEHEMEDRRQELVLTPVGFSDGGNEWSLDDLIPEESSPNKLVLLVDYFSKGRTLHVVATPDFIDEVAVRVSGRVDESERCYIAKSVACHLKRSLAEGEELGD